MSCGCKCSYCVSCNSTAISNVGTKIINDHNYGTRTAPIKKERVPKDLYTKKQAD